MLGKRILKESLSVSPEITERAETVVSEVWKQVTGEVFDVSAITAPFVRDIDTGDVVEIPYFNGKILKLVTDMCAEKLLIGIAGSKVVEHYGYGTETVGLIPAKDRLVNAIASYIYWAPAVNIRLNSSKLASTFTLEQSSLKKVVPCFGATEKDVLTFLAVLLTLKPVEATQTAYWNEKRADSVRHDKEAKKAAGVEKRRLAKIQKAKEEADMIAAMSDEERDAYLANKAAETRKKMLKRVKNTAIKKVQELKDASDTITGQADRISIEDWLKDHVISIKFDYPDLAELPDDMPDKDKARLNEFFEGFKASYPEIVNSPEHFAMVTRGPEKDPSYYGFWGLNGKVRFDTEFKDFPDAVKDLVIGSVELSQKNRHNALMPKDIDKEFANVYLCFALLSLFNFNLDFYNSNGKLYDDEGEIVEVSDVDNALDLNWDAPFDDNDDGLDESFEEEDLPDDPFLAEYESALFDVDELERAQAEVDALRADDSLEEDIGDNSIAGDIMKIAQNYRKAFKK